ncbi:MAG: hypothetical protein ABL903_12470, partial [Methylococcales bacterium]
RYRARRIGAFPFAYRGLKNITSLTLRFHVFQRWLWVKPFLSKYSMFQRFFLRRFNRLGFA